MALLPWAPTTGIADRPLSLAVFEVEAQQAVAEVQNALAGRRTVTREQPIKPATPLLDEAGTDEHLQVLSHVGGFAVQKRCQIPRYHPACP